MQPRGRLPPSNIYKLISVLVDSFTITGERITIDAGIVDYTKADGTTVQVVVPYIGYFNGTSRLPTVAKLVVPEGGVMNYNAQGTVDDIFTGNWEISIVPSSKTLTTNYYDKKSTDNVHGTTNGSIYGNGTTNPILGYAIESSSGTCLETAQMK